jgi:response regulator aspartate phosphatase A (stage 0 sporulation protein L)
VCTRVSLSKNLNDEIMAKMFEFIHALYVDSGKEKLNSILNYIELKSMLSDVEDLAAAKY